MRKNRKDEDASRRRRSRAVVGMAAVLGFVAATDLAMASNWIVGLNGGSSGEAQAGTVSNLTITALASPAPGHLLYPGYNGDVVAKIHNPNSVPVTITALNIPDSSVRAAGYSDSALSTPLAGCDATDSGVTWSFAGGSASSHTLTTPLVVAGNSDLTVTFTNDASMSASSAAACEGAYFSMPSLTGVSASVTSDAATTSPATDAWTS